MQHPHQLVGVAHRIFNAAIVPTAWRAALDAMVDWLHADHAMVVIHDTARREPVVATSAGMDETDFQRFLTPEAARWMAPFRASMPDATVVTWSQLVSERNFKRSEFYNAVVRPANGFYAMALRYELPTFSAFMAICRQQRCGDFAASDVVTLQALMPHLTSTLQFHAWLRAHEARYAVLTAMLDKAKADALRNAPESNGLGVADTASAAASPTLQPGPVTHLLGAYLQSLLNLDAPPSADLSQLVGLHLMDLIDAASRRTTERCEVIAVRRSSSERQRAVFGEIARRCGNPALDVDVVARRLGLSRRSIQRLLEQTGKSFVEHVVEQRLQRAHAMLSDARWARLRIIDIASACGFGDVSNFNRAFRRRFGNTPSKVRAVLRDGGALP